MRNHTVLIIAIWFAAVAAGCGQTETSNSEASAAAASEPTVATITSSHRDVNAARTIHDQSVALWSQNTPSGYKLTFNNSVDVYTATFENGSFVGSDAPDDFGIPLSVDGLFHEMGTAISNIEADPSSQGTDEGGCEGIFFEYGYDEENGSPTSYSRLTPCDDGLAWQISVTATDF